MARLVGSLGDSAHHALVAGFAAKLAGGRSLLDAGCGDAGLTEYLDLTRFQYVGVDRSHTAITRAKLRGTAIDVRQCTFDDYEPGRRFDIIVFNESLSVIERPLETLDRFRSFLIDDGFIVISLFQAAQQTGNGVILAEFLQAEFANARYQLVEIVEASNLQHSLTWRVDVVK